MAILVREWNGRTEEETEVFLFDPNELEDGSVQGVIVHPWYRGGSGEVAVTVGYFNRDGNLFEGGDGESPYEIAIMDRQDFVEGLLAVFPELKRA